jgi:hypothetical protein
LTLAASAIGTGTLRDGKDDEVEKVPGRAVRPRRPPY